MNTSHAHPPLAVLWDFGGVILTSPFEAFRIATSARPVFPKISFACLNARNPDANAWAKMERSEVSLDGVRRAVRSRGAAHGHKLDGWRVLKAISGDIRPQMVEALRRCRAAFRVACITNNMKPAKAPAWRAAPRRPSRRRSDDAVRACRRIEQARLPQARPAHLPARLRADRRAAGALRLSRRSRHQPEAGASALGMRTIKVGDPDVAIAELEAIVGIPLRG